MGRGAGGGRKPGGYPPERIITDKKEIAEYLQGVGVPVEHLESIQTIHINPPEFAESYQEAKTPGGRQIGKVEGKNTVYFTSTTGRFVQRHEIGHILYRRLYDPQTSFGLQIGRQMERELSDEYHRVTGLSFSRNNTPRERMLAQRNYLSSYSGVSWGEAFAEGYALWFSGSLGRQRVRDRSPVLTEYFESQGWG